LPNSPTFARPVKTVGGLHESSELPESLEIGPRIYFVNLVDAYAWDFAGEFYHIDHDEQLIYLNGACPEGELAGVLSRAARRAMRRCCPGWRLVPLVGTIS
jgi:hypothetical protein